MAKITIPCTRCGAPIRRRDRFCDGCGLEVAEDERIKLQGLIREAKEMRIREQQTRAMAIGKGTSTLGGLAILEFVGALAGSGRIAQKNPGDPAVLRTFLFGAAMGGVMLGLRAWSRLDPLLPLAIALALVVVEMGLVAVLTPPGFISALVVGGVSVVALVSGVRAALQARAIENRRQ